MRLLLLLVLLVCNACKTAEFAVDHQMSGIRIAAKFESKDSAPIAEQPVAEHKNL